MAKFLPTKDFHVLEIVGLSPDELKESYKRCNKDRNVFRLNSALNFIIKSFGLKGNISHYTRWYNEKLLPFMNDNGLRNCTDLTKHTVQFSDFPSFTHQQIADRLYNSQKIPRRIFMGHNLALSVNDGYLHVAKSLDNNGYQNLEVIHPNATEILFHYRSLIGDTFVENNPDAKDEYIYLRYDEDKGLYKDMDYQSNDENKSVFNGFGSSFLSDRLDYYKANDIVTHVDFAKDVKNIFRRFKDAWIEVIPFEGIYFLKASNGDYDFVFKNLRDTPFTTVESSFAPYLKHMDVPSVFNEDYDFKRWFYFGHKDKSKSLRQIETNTFFEERDRHFAEINYYLSGGKADQYPGYDYVLREYYKKQGKYQYISATDRQDVDLFKKVSLGKNQTLLVSELISIKDFSLFLVANPLYLKNRHSDLEDLESVNSLENGLYPANVTWYDAVAYCNWIEKEHNIPVRLLKASEYKSIHPKKEGYGSLASSHQFEGVKFDGYDNYPPSLSPNSFKKLKFLFNKPPKVVKSNENISFCIEPQFGEWLFQFDNNLASMILPFSMGSYYFGSNVDSVVKPYMLATSSGKYKKLKVGFRICCEVEKDKVC